MLTQKEKEIRAKKAVEILKERYPDSSCALQYEGDPWRLLVMGRLSAQCTDARVNIVCRELFRRFPDAKSMAQAPIGEIEKLVFSCGVYKVKAQNIKDFSAIICERFEGRVPDTMEALLTLPGVGRKIANLVLGDVFGKPGIVADTHCIRLNGRFGFYPQTLKDPAKVEKILDGIVPKETQADYCHRMVLFGREYCTARTPRCTECPLRPECEEGKKNI